MSAVTIILVYHPFSRAPLLVINLCIHMQSLLPGRFKHTLQFTAVSSVQQKLGVKLYLTVILWEPTL